MTHRRDSRLLALGLFVFPVLLLSSPCYFDAEHEQLRYDFADDSSAWSRINGHAGPTWEGDTVVFRLENAGELYRGSLHMRSKEEGMWKRRRISDGRGEPVGEWGIACDTAPDLSPGGKYLLYSTLRHAAKPGDFEIMLREMETGREWQLTSEPGADTSPVWSPFGDQIAFVSTRGQGLYYFGLYVMNARGEDVRAVAPDVRASDRPPVWSPDGSKLAFLAIEGTWDKESLYVVDVEGGGLTYIGEAARGSRPAWSPDSERIAFIDRARGTSATSVWIANAEGSDHEVVIEGRGIEAILWTPDGSELVYVSPAYSSDPGGLFAISIAERTIRQIAPSFRDLGSVTGMTWSPDATRIAVRVYGPVVVHIFAADGSDMPSAAPETQTLAAEERLQTASRREWR